MSYARFDSDDSGRATSRWACMASSTPLQLRCDPPNYVTRLRSASDVVREWRDPLAALSWLSTEGRAEHWRGWISYDLGRWFETLPATANDDLRLPLFVFTTHDSITPHTDDSAALGAATPRDASAGICSTLTRDAYHRAVTRALDYIAAGDVFQVNLAQRFSAPTALSPPAIYERLRSHAPATFGACLVYDDFSLISNSPELFLRVAPDRRVITRPIKGTRPRGPGMQDELRRSAKDQAELAMIVDLERNDLGRVCEVGSVRVTEPRAIEAHPTVYHGVATIDGVLRRDVTFVDLLRATFPGGSITGAPKIRAMEIIEELEPVRRGPYCGAIGYLAADGSMEFNIAIRTMIVKDGLVHIPVGGGIVADSKPEDEYEETLVKAKAMFDALGLVIQSSL